MFKVDSTGNETVLYSFSGGADGSTPKAPLIGDANGNLYGTTLAGGSPASTCFEGGCGVIFKLDPAGIETVLYSFTDGTDGEFPQSGLVRNSQGNLYGAAAFGGSGVGGVVFKLTPAGTLVVLHSFDFTDGFQPAAALLPYKGYLYSTTGAGGIAGAGVVFKITP